MIIGYARVSTKDQNLDLQVSAVKNAGCEKIFKEKLSAVKDRPKLDLMISTLRKNDTVILAPNTFWLWPGKLISLYKPLRIIKILLNLRVILKILISGLKNGE